MNIAPNPNHYSKNSVSFKSLKAPNADDIKVVQRFVDCGIGNLWSSLISSVESKTTGIVKEIDGVKYIPEDNFLQKATEGVKTFFGMPLDVIDAVARKFPNSRFYNSRLLQKHRENQLVESEIHALQGLYENGIKYTKEIMSKLPEGSKYPTDKNCNSYCHSICDPVAQKFKDSLNAKMADKVADYDTKKERFAARLISGGTAAIFLGNDFYNKAIQKGKTEKEAVKEQHLKQRQEVKENICEAVTQFAALACFSKQVNSSPWAPALISTAIGLVSRIISRKTSGMQITRVKVPESSKTGIPTINEFVKSAKENSTKELLDKKQEEAKNPKAKKKPLLSLKNILMFCAASILGGYALRFASGKIKINGQSITDKIQSRANKFNESMTEQVFAKKEKLEKLSNVLSLSKEKKLAKNIDTIVADHTEADGTINLGRVYKRINLRGDKTEVREKDLYLLATAPFRFVKEIVSYPYKIVHGMETAIRNSKLKAQGIEPPKPPKFNEDKYNIISIYKRFIEFEKISGGNDDKLRELFSDYVKRMRLASNNNITASKSDNSKIAVIATTLGTLTGMWFNMNDEFNASIRNGSSKEEAEKDARLRGINKFIRMSVQTIILGSLNSIFRKQYNSSISKACIIVAASTFLTDSASRILSGMPMGKKTSEELAEYQRKKKEEGLSAKYYKLIDKLAS